ncbi:MAG: tetratricopeptide repeat protein [Chloroflexi bacterium]|nr:tetratricopeptide repeat protein [Chloroflexota bacterium]
MVYYQISEKTKLRRHRTNEAIALAMQNRWEEAVAVNKGIIEMFPDDADAYNRLGKALTQLGRYAGAREAYKRSLEIKPGNTIARKNLDRLSHLANVKSTQKTGKQVGSHLFIEETGKTEVTNLLHLASRGVLAKLSAGDPVNLKPKGQRLIVESMEGEYIGEIEPKLGLRLVKLMNGGNKYSAAIARISDDKGKVMIKEIYQHPSQAGRPSFPARATDDFRPYVRGSLLKYELEEDEEGLEDEYSGEWEGEETVKESGASLGEAGAFPDEDGGEGGFAIDDK